MTFKKIVAGIISVLTISSALISVIPASADEYNIEFSISATLDDVASDGSGVTISFDLDKNTCDNAGNLMGFVANLNGENTDMFSVKKSNNGSVAITDETIQGSCSNNGQICNIELTLNDGVDDGIFSVYYSLSETSYNVIENGEYADDPKSYISETKPDTNTLYFKVVENKIVEVSNDPIVIVTTTPEETTTTTTTTTTSETTTTTTITTTTTTTISETTTTPKSDETTTTTPKGDETTTTTPKSDGTTTTTPKSDGTTTTTPKDGTVTTTTSNDETTTTITTTDNKDKKSSETKSSGKSPVKTSDSGVPTAMALLIGSALGMFLCKKSK